LIWSIFSSLSDTQYTMPSWEDRHLWSQHFIDRHFSPPIIHIDAVSEKPVGKSPCSGWDYLTNPPHRVAGRWTKNAEDLWGADELTDAQYISWFRLEYTIWGNLMDEIREAFPPSNGW